MAESQEKYFTWPNFITTIRLFCIPFFLYLLFVKEDAGSAAWLLAALGSTDWVDGYIARRFDSVSDFGALYDPSVDRLLFIVAAPALLLVDAMPLAIGIAAICRELSMVCAAFYLYLRRAEKFPVTWSGKTGTFLLMFAFPMFLGASSDLSYASFLAIAAWFFAIPGLVYSFYSLFFEYVPAAKRSLEQV